MTTIKPWNVAASLLRAYFTTKSVANPQDEAAILLAELPTGRGMGDTQMQQAMSIVQRAAFDVDDLVENHLHVDLAIEDLHRFDRMAGAPVFGLARPNDWAISICERALGYQPLYRATMMHEAAHLLLHSNSEKSMPLCYSPGSNVRPAHEREADLLMASALLPFSVLELTVALIANLWGMNRFEAMDGANSVRGRWQWEMKYLPSIINNLCVSKHLTLMQAKRMGWIEQSTLDHHLQLPTPSNQWLVDSDHDKAPLRRSIQRFMSRLNQRQDNRRII